LTTADTDASVSTTSVCSSTIMARQSVVGDAVLS
jgi:hypothetical protein